MVPNKPKDYALKFAVGFGVALFALAVLGLFSVGAMELSLHLFGKAGFLIGFAVILSAVIGANFAWKTDANGNTYSK
jgi:hypothetical protein